MKLTPLSHPDHIGHIRTEGCFRCHSGRHVTETGERISKDCDLCHTIVEQGVSSHFDFTYLKDKLPFRHPTDIGEDWKTEGCAVCHSKLNM